MYPWNVEAWVPEIKDSSLLLTCRNHPNLVWNQKNLGYLGARSIFFFGWLISKPDARCSLGVRNTWDSFHPETGQLAVECDCSGEDLVIVYGPYLLEQELLGPPEPC